MKKIAIAILATVSFSCKAQQYPTLDISQLACTESITGIYYRDTQGLLNPFEGTYVYSQGGKMIKIVLQKKEMSSTNDRYFEDLLIGEYQYIFQ